MKIIRQLLLLLLVSNAFQTTVNSQSDSVIFEYLSKFNYEIQTFPTPMHLVMTAHLDANGQPFVYAASRHLGLVVFDMSDEENIVPVDTLLPVLFDGSYVMDIYQHGHFLYLSFGDIWLNNQNTGLAILDVSDPTQIQILDIWSSPDLRQNAGGAAVVSDGNYAYVGAFREGLLIFDVSNKEQIQFVSQFIPDPNFPTPPSGFQHPQARGLALKDNIIFLCNDSKGFRAIDVSNKQQPVEVGKFINTDLIQGAVPAYNGVAISGNYAYVAIDYCGMDIIDISDPANMQLVNWYDPWDCRNNTWHCADIHTNQVRILGDSLLFVSGAETEVIALDIKDKANPIQVGTFGQPGDQSVTWGLDVKGNKLALANFHNPPTCSPFSPYQSNWGGVQILEWSMDFPSDITNIQSNFKREMTIAPMPVTDQFNLIIQSDKNTNGHLEIFNIHGQRVIRETLMISEGKQVYPVTSVLLPGVYLAKLIFEDNSTQLVCKLVR